MFSRLWSSSFTVQLMHLDTTSTSCFFQKRQNKNLLSAGTICLQAQDSIKRSPETALVPGRETCSPMPVFRSIQRAAPGLSTLLRGEEKPQSANSANSQPPSCLLETCSLERINGISLFLQAPRARTSTSVFGKRIWRLDKSGVISKRGSGAEGTTVLLSSNKAVTTKKKKRRQGGGGGDVWQVWAVSITARPQVPKQRAYRGPSNAECLDSSVLKKSQHTRLPKNPLASKLLLI